MTTPTPLFGIWISTSLDEIPGLVREIKLAKIKMLPWGGRPLTKEECFTECKAIWKEFHQGTFDPWLLGEPLSPKLKNDWIRVECCPTIETQESAMLFKNGLKPNMLHIYGFDSRKHDGFFFEDPVWRCADDEDDDDDEEKA